MKNISQPAFLNQLLRKCDCRDPTVVEPDQIWHLLYRLSHCFGLLQRHRQRFFAPYDFSRLRCGHRYRRVQHVRHCDVQDLNVASVHNFLPIGCNLLPAPLRGHCVQLGAISSANHAQIQVISNRKKSLHLMKGVGVRSRDEAVPNHRYV